MQKKFIQKTLDKLFPNPKTPLDFSNPFTLLIATMLSANSRDIVVNKVTKILFKKAKSPQEMLKLSQNEIEKIIRPTGLGPTRSKNTLKICTILTKKHNSKVPLSFKELEILPGIGHKTASVVIGNYSKKIKTFPVDTHIFRLAKRWGLTNQNSSIKQTEKDLKNIFPEKDWYKIHLQMIYFGRLFCKAIGHLKASCPVCSKIL
jgi:endonuclease III